MITVTPSTSGDARAAKRRSLRLTHGEKRSVVGMASFVLLLHLVGWGTLIALVAPREYQVAGQLFGADTSGMLYAFSPPLTATATCAPHCFSAYRRRP